MNVHKKYEILTEKFVSWAKENDNIRAALILGSRARKDKPADRWSDLDVVIIADQPEALLFQTNWLAQMGNPCITFLEKTAVSDNVERRVLYDDGLDVDFSVVPSYFLKEMATSQEIQGVLARGYKVILDKDNVFKNMKFESFSLSEHQKPNLSEFLNEIHDFWYHAVWTAKKLRRGEILVGKTCCDQYMKHLLLKMIKWQVSAKANWQNIDIWHGSRFFEQWVSSAVLEKLKSVYSRYEEDDIWQALHQTMKLYREIAVETASLLGYDYAHLADETAAKIVIKLDQEREK
ncbi:aminoglycoside 6-adenylyltransferase [Bacillus oleivorans]|uniref:Aminoglycoside 6-adenylyltransferase n=1 Tax=Bacillus oleivorans TaxID=1448271 RepID=A0A285CYJ6_9BACI|nr:aminoglycoside 6-adenylyltransferase [Bacillus oleivorans]SNX72644.1 aminoglycoside 6-adenylyltransferase [Bacillus oleivorans]